MEKGQGALRHEFNPYLPVPKLRIDTGPELSDEAGQRVGGNIGKLWFRQVVERDAVQDIDGLLTVRQNQLFALRGQVLVSTCKQLEVLQYVVLELLCVHGCGRDHV